MWWEIVKLFIAAFAIFGLLYLMDRDGFGRL
jgi:hypothetical protein